MDEDGAHCPTCYSFFAAVFMLLPCAMPICKDVLVFFLLISQ